MDYCLYSLTGTFNVSSLVSRVTWYEKSDELLHLSLFFVQVFLCLPFSSLISCVFSCHIFFFPLTVIYSFLGHLTRKEVDICTYMYINLHVHISLSLLAPFLHPYRYLRKISVCALSVYINTKLPRLLWL